MIELIILYKLCVRIGEAAREKGRRADRYQRMLIVFWIVGEFGTMLLAGAVRVLVFGEVSGSMWLVYSAGIVGGFVGAALAFHIVAGLTGPGSDDPAATEAGSGTRQAGDRTDVCFVCRKRLLPEELAVQRRLCQACRF